MTLGPMTLNLAFIEISIVFGSIGHKIYTAAMEEIIFELSFILVPIRTHHLTLTMSLSISQFTFILSCAVFFHTLPGTNILNLILE